MAANRHDTQRTKVDNHSFNQCSICSYLFKRNPSYAAKQLASVVSPIQLYIESCYRIKWNVYLKSFPLQMFAAWNERLFLRINRPVCPSPPAWRLGADGSDGRGPRWPRGSGDGPLGPSGSGSGSGRGGGWSATRCRGPLAVFR